MGLTEDRATALAGRGSALRARGRPQEALVPLLEALSQAPTHRQAQLELALALRESGRRDEARTLYSLLLNRRDVPARAWHGLAQLCQAEGQMASAEACLRRAVALAPADLGIRLDLGDLLARRGALAEAVEWFHGVLAVEAGNPHAHAGLGLALIGLGRLAEARDHLERALTHDPGNVIAHLARARLTLLSGDPAAAGQDLGWRWSAPGARRPRPPGVAWDGRADLSGRTVLLWAEQGAAETIHALHAVPVVAARGARVVLGVPRALVSLAAGLVGVETVLVSGEPLPAGMKIDFNASLADLPHLLDGDIAPAPYLSAPQDRRVPLRAPASARLKVGVAWAGARDDWAVPLTQLMPLLSLPGMAFYSLQTGPRAKEAADLLHPALMADLSPSLGDFADLAARMAELDVVVAADGAVAHLAGALGKPVCVLVPQAPDWRWRLERADSPWYAGARLFRQTRPDNWNRPVQDVCAHLRRLAAETADDSHSLSGAVAEAGILAGQGSSALVGGELTAAGALFGRALALDGNNVEALSNLGILLRHIGRLDAATACWGRALAAGAGAAVRANLANALRELGYPLAAEEEFTRVLTDEPDNPQFLYGLGLLERERGRSREAAALFERALHLRPASVPRHQLATALLKAGDLARGMAEMAHRPPPRLPAVKAPAWDGGRLDGRTLLLRDEGDAIDTVMLARFIPLVARLGGKLVVECVPEAARLLEGLPGVDQVVARGKALPAVDAVAHLLDLPRLTGAMAHDAPPREVPYLHRPDGVAPHRFEDIGQLRVGICWSGRATDRPVPLTTLLRLAADPRLSLVSLQRGTRTDDLAAVGATPYVADLGRGCADLADSAALVAGLDLIIAADSAEAHLAGAMGKPVFVLLPTTADWRWVDGREDALWYPTMRVFRQGVDGSWDNAIARAADAAGAMAAVKLGR